MISSNASWTVEGFYEELDHFKSTIPSSPVKRSVVMHVSTQWITVLLQGEVLHRIKLSLSSSTVQWCGFRLASDCWVTVLSFYQVHDNVKMTFLRSIVKDSSTMVIGDVRVKLQFGDEVFD